MEQFLRMEVTYQIIDFDRSRGVLPSVESSAEVESEFRKAGEGDGTGFWSERLESDWERNEGHEVPPGGLGMSSLGGTPAVSLQFRGRLDRSEPKVAPLILIRLSKGNIEVFP